MPNSNGVDIIFCGNCGVGKSTLLTSISGVQFKSGVSYGEGLTDCLRFQDSPIMPGLRFGDTPGLADISMAEKAAAAITQALRDAARQRRTVKIFFVWSLESGRVKPDDQLTIKKVMGSITLADGSKPGGYNQNQYGLIINKCSLMERPDFHNGGKKKLEMVVGVQKPNVPFTTEHVIFLARDPNADDEDNAKVLFKELMPWIHSFPGIGIATADMIDVSSLEEQLAQARDEHIREMEKLERVLTQRNAQAIAQMEAEQARNRRALEQQLEDVKREAATRGGGIMGAVFDLGAIIAKPICSAIDKNNPRFERDWQEYVGTVKKYCVV